LAAGCAVEAGEAAGDEAGEAIGGVPCAGAGG
jgi:hypothetical protein